MFTSIGLKLFETLKQSLFSTGGTLKAAQGHLYEYVGYNNKVLFYKCLGSNRLSGDFLQSICSMLKDQDERARAAAGL